MERTELLLSLKTENLNRKTHALARSVRQEILDNIEHARYEDVVAFSGILSCIIRAPEDAA
jgi:hypothetical protein